MASTGARKQPLGSQDTAFPANSDSCVEAQHLQRREPASLCGDQKGRDTSFPDLHFFFLVRHRVAKLARVPRISDTRPFAAGLLGLCRGTRERERERKCYGKRSLLCSPARARTSSVEKHPAQGICSGRSSRNEILVCLPYRAVCAGG